MRHPLSLFVLASLLASSAFSQATRPRGHVFFEADFDTPDALKPWHGGALAPGVKGQALLIERSAPGTTVVSIKLPVEQMRGYTVYGYAMVKAEGVSQRPQSWNGIKFMAPIESPDGGKSWPQAKIEAGSFDWRKVSFSAKVPEDATSMSLVLGLEAVSGKVWFDDVRIIVGKPPMPEPAPRPGRAFRGDGLPPRLRGAMIAPKQIDEPSLRTLGQDWGANLVRWQLIRYGAEAKIATAAEYDAWLERELKKLDQFLPLCEKYGVWVVLDLHSPFGGKPVNGGYVGSDSALFTSKEAQDHFVAGWKLMARRYKDAKMIWGYDLVNEPVEGAIAEDCEDWHGLATRAARAIREIDAKKAIIVEPNDWGGPDGLRTFRPIDVPDVVYSVHMYIPGRFTHQGVHDKNQSPVAYPGLIDGKLWNKAELEKSLAPVVAFQKKYNVTIYIGEFSAIRWAPDNSAERYLRDVIEIFEAHGWDWSYHAYREWSGWSVEHGEDKNDGKPAKEPTGRQKLLMEWFKKNQK